MKGFPIFNLLILGLFMVSCSNNSNNYRELQINKELVETREFINSEIQSKHKQFQSKKAALIVQRGDTTIINYWMNKANQVSKRADGLIHFLTEQENRLLDGKTYSSWQDLELIENLNDTKRVSKLFLTPNHGVTKGREIKDSLKSYIKNVFEEALNYKYARKEYSFKFPEFFSNNNLDYEQMNPDDTAWVAEIIYRYSDILETETNKIWDELQFKDASLIDGINVLERLKNVVRFAELEMVNFMLYKNDGHFSSGIPDAIEYKAIGEAKTIHKGEDLVIEVQLILRKEGEEFDVIYGVNDDNEKNWKPSYGKFTVQGTKVGVNRVYGKVKTKQEGEIRWLPFEYEFTVVE